MKEAPPPKGAAQRQDIEIGVAIILPFPAQQQLRVSPDLARVSWLTRRPADRLRVGRHRRRMAAYRRCA